MWISFVCKRHIRCLRLNFLIGYKTPVMGVFLVLQVITVSPCRELLAVVAILYNDNYVMSSCISNKSGRLISATFSINSTTFQLCDIYGPNTSREGDVFFEFLYPVLDAQILCILCGDFNTVVDPHVDRRGCNPFSPWAYNWSRTLSELMSVFDLQDAWRTQHPDAVSFTWHRPRHRVPSIAPRYVLAQFLFSPTLVVGWHLPLLPFRPLSCIFEIFST